MLLRLAAKLARIGRGNEQDRNRQGNKILERDIQHVKQLLLRQVIPPEQVEKHVPRAVKRRALIRIEQKDEQVVEHKEHECKGHHEPHFAETDFAQAENAHTYQQERQQHTRVIGHHAGKGEQQKEHQLGCARQLMYDALSRQIIENCLSGHGCAPPCRFQ